jgi:sterol desaturase/sphingolipid hydroxylase (fatty acid hydroxylase superfamily)
MFPEDLADWAPLRSLVYGAAMLAFLFVVVASLEARFGGDMRRYRTRGFLTDLAYGIVYLGGIYQLLVFAPIFTAIALVIPDTWHLRALQALPPLAGFLIYWVVADFIAYWLHRSMHHVPLLWRVHRVHHAQTSITFVTSWRNHILEQLYFNLMMYVPLMILGMPKWYWLPVMLLQYVFEALQHADLKWRYGRLYPVFVSPVFHAIHHAPERARHDGNYGKIFSAWDHLFGTVSAGPRPERYGLMGQPMPVSFWGTMLAPFHGAGDRAPEPVSGGEPAATRLGR